MKILLIHDIEPPFAGAEKVVKETIKLLQDKGHEVKIYYGAKEEKHNLLNYIERFYNLKERNKIKKIIKNFKPDVIHSHGTNLQISESIDSYIKKKKINHVKTIHNFGYYCPKSWGIFQDGKVCTKGYNLLCPFYNCYTAKMGKKYLLYNILKWLKVGLHRKFIKKYVDNFICPSLALKEAMIKTLKIPKEKVTYLPNFIDYDKNIKIDNSKINPKQFLFVGRISKEKGIDIAIKATNYLIKKGKIKEIKLKIIGDGEELEHLQKLKEKLNLKDEIEFVGKINNKNLNKYYQESIATIMPSILLENNPLVALESMTNKKPIIASNIGGYPDLVKDGINGFLFEMGNYKELAEKMQELYDNKELSIKMGEQGFRMLDNFSKEKYYKKLIQIYKSKTS